MGLKEDLKKEVVDILSSQWTTRDGQVIPAPEDLALGNDAVALDATVLYADISGSTSMVDAQTATRAAEFYKCYMICAARIIKNAGGSVTAYDGDRIMGVFIGDLKNTTAAKTALKLNYAIWHMVNPAIRDQYGDKAYRLRHVIGIDSSRILASRIGVRNDNDIEWVGPAANYAAKLSSLSEPDWVYITARVFDLLHESGKVGGNPTRSMWEERSWIAMNNMRVYRSNWYWEF